MKWRGSNKYPPEQERERQRMVEEAKADRLHRKRLQAIRDKEDLYGDEALTSEERALKAKHHDFFYPEEAVTDRFFVTGMNRPEEWFEGEEDC